MPSSTWQWLGRVPDVKVQSAEKVEPGFGSRSVWRECGILYTPVRFRTFRQVNLWIT